MRQQDKVKQQEFATLKQSILEANAQNEQLIYSLKSQLKQVTQARTEDTQKQNETIKQFKDHFLKWQNDCKSVEDLKVANDQLVIQMRKEYKIQIAQQQQNLEKVSGEYTKSQEECSALKSENLQLQQRFEAEVKQLESAFVEASNAKATQEFQLEELHIRLNELNQTNQDLQQRLLHAEQKTSQMDHLQTQVSMQQELIDRQKQTIAELVKAKEQLTAINEQLQAKIDKHSKI